jgi:hypothetical protein
VLLGRARIDSAATPANRAFPGLVLSAGPNGVLETSFPVAAKDASMVSIGGDDVGVRIPLPD